MPRVLDEMSEATEAVAAWAPPSGRWRALASGRRPERSPRGPDAAWLAMEGRVRGLYPRRRVFMRRAKRVLARAGRLAAVDEGALGREAGELRARFRLGREDSADQDRAIALGRELAARRLGLRPYGVQVAAAFALEAGCALELATGEGKTLVAALAAVLAGWRGRGCHVITVNDYLARRDAETMEPLYRACGLRVAHVEEEMTSEQRRRAYAADVTYATNKEVAADYLRDRLKLGRRRSLTATLLENVAGAGDPERRGATGDGGGGAAPRLVMRGLACAIVDEADSVLIDEAVTPLILSGGSPNAQQVEAFENAARLAEPLERGPHYRVSHRWREVRLTARGAGRVAQRCEAERLGGLWAGDRRRRELIVQALTARELYRAGRQYVVRDGRVVIVDPFTGRLMPDRTWRDGLHQAVEAKEGLEIRPPQRTRARMSFQRFFRLYGRLSGMTGTAWEARHELWSEYRLPTVRIPTHRPCLRRVWPERLYASEEDRWDAVVREVRELHAGGRAVLIGTRSVRASEHLSRLLEGAGLGHQVLNAVRHAEEARIIERAGESGRITVATNMAGRGTDIKLGPGVAERGGLHVIATERHASGRVDRQLFGRAARQGDPGSAAARVCLEDDLLRRHAPARVRALLRCLASHRGRRSRLARFLLKTVQRRAERTAARRRRHVRREDERLDEHLAFAAPDA